MPKFHPGPNFIIKKKTNLASKENETEAACFKIRS